MRRGCSFLACALVVIAGAFVAPAFAAADQSPKLTLAPAIVAVATDQHEVSFVLVNSSPDALPLKVAASDAWVIPAVKSLTIAANQRVTVKASVVIPTGHDAGDHETDLSFATLPGTDGMLRISWAVAARVLVNAGGSIVHGLHVFGLTAPWIADSFDTPAVNLTLSNRGNVHEIVTIAPFGQTIVYRNSTRTLSLTWSNHPWIGRGTITAGGESVSTLFLPWRLGLGLLALLCGLLLVRTVRRTP